MPLININKSCFVSFFILFSIKKCNIRTFRGIKKKLLTLFKSDDSSLEDYGREIQDEEMEAAGGA